MTRINVAVKPSELSDKHLLAEHREIKRIPNHVRKHLPDISNLPDQFTLGKGHVRFFYDKMEYLFDRYMEIYRECLNRGFNVTCYASAWNNIPDEYWGDYVHTKEDREIILSRIKERTYDVNTG